MLNLRTENRVGWTSRNDNSADDYVPLDLGSELMHYIVSNPFLVSSMHILSHKIHRVRTQ